MRAARYVVLLALLCLSPFTPPPADTQATPAGLWTYRYDSFAINLIPGERVQVGFAVEMNFDELPGSFRWEGRYGSITAALSLEVRAVNPQVIFAYISTEELMQQCIRGYLSVSDRIYQIHPDGSETLLASRAGLAPCNWAGATATPRTPVQSFVCGANNDILRMAAQPAGVALESDSGWRGNTRTVTYRAEGSYVLSGPAVFTFTDQPNRLCPSPIYTPPPRVLPPRTPIPLRPTPRGFPAPRVTIVPAQPTPDTWTPSPYPPDYTPPAPPMLRTPLPLRPTPRGFPFPGFPSLPFVQQDLPAEHVKDPSAAMEPASASTGKSLVIALAPLALVLGGIAAWRRHDD